jgi:multidrug efflux pump subunit AcrA (membrane-fusion protein)
MLLLAASLAVGYWLWRPSQPAPTAPTEVPPVLLAASGLVMPDQRAVLSFTLGGRISHLYVEEGDQVAAGQPLARLDPTSITVDPTAPGASGQAYLMAPFAGTVGIVHVRQWETVAPGAPVLELGDLSWLRIEVDDLAEGDIGQVAVGQPVEITFEALPDRKEVGWVASVAPMAAERKGRQSYRVIVDFPERAPAGVRWGMTANVDIIVRPGGPPA